MKDVIIGKIYFLLVRIKIKNMDLEIRRRESTGAGANTHVETETLAKFELMDGAPVRGILMVFILIPHILTSIIVDVAERFSFIPIYLLFSRCHVMIEAKSFSSEDLIRFIIMFEIMC